MTSNVGSQKYFRKTRSFCPQCKKLVAASIIESGNGLSIKWDCPEDGLQIGRFLRDKRFLAAIDPYIDRTNERSVGDDWRGTYDHIAISRDLYIDLTEQCNFNCPACYTNANAQPAPPLTQNEIFSAIDRIPRKIVVSLLGGEPTLRPDLPAIVKYISGRGHIVKLITNGSLLSDKLVDDLCLSGLEWVILQFDGFSDEIYRRLRGRPLLSEKLKVIETLAARKINIVLASMIVPGVNDGHVGRILHFALCHPQIVQIGFLPVSDLGRNTFGDQSELETSEFIDLIETQTNNKIQRSDFVRAVREGQIYTRLTGNLAYKSRTCCQGVFLFHDGYSEAEISRSASQESIQALYEGKTLMPIDKALLPGHFVTHPRKTVSALKTIAHWNKNPVNPNLLGIVIEKFRNRNALDFDDAKNCTKVYLTREGFIPNCLNNLIYRPNPQNEQRQG
jgi:uncharacterized radical SAM superfamily Fe-S cluster-containing enzyme